jgi:dienelactone hydrolase
MSDLHGQRAPAGEPSRRPHRRDWRGVALLAAAVALGAAVVAAVEYLPGAVGLATGSAAAAAEDQPTAKQTVVRGVRQSMDHFPSAGKKIRMEKYLPLKEGKYPAVILLYGSGGIGPGPNGLRDLARDYARRGYVALLPHYFDQTGIRMANFVTIDRQFVTWMGAINHAIDHARGLPEVDGDHIGLVGWSLGGSLALEVAATNDHVAAVVGVVGGMAKVILDKMKRMPPTLLLDGGQDPNYPVELARNLARTLKAKGVLVESVIYSDQGHAFTGAAAVDAGRRTAEWFDRYLHERPAADKDRPDPP